MDDVHDYACDYSEDRIEKTFPMTTTSNAVSSVGFNSAGKTSGLGAAASSQSIVDREFVNHHQRKLNDDGAEPGEGWNVVPFPMRDASSPTGAGSLRNRKSVQHGTQTKIGLLRILSSPSTPRGRTSRT